jgi:hypothetical protein
MRQRLFLPHQRPFKCIKWKIRNRNEFAALSL